MNFFKKTLALLLCIALLTGLVGAVGVSAASPIGTEANPENANNKYFSAGQAYLLNTDLAAGDKDGYWYQYTATSAGLLCVDAIGKDANGNNTDNYQVTVKCNGKNFYAFADFYTRPIVPFKVNRGDIITIHLTAKPDKNGNYPKLKIYCNLTTVHGNSSAPVMIKSTDSFVANIESNKSVVYQDGTNGGRYGGKGIKISYNKAIISMTEVTVNGTVYKDTDKDGVIELTLPGDPNAMIATHPVFSIYNGSPVDCTYFIRVSDSAKEGAAPPPCKHSLKLYERIEPCHKSGREAYWYCSVCNTYFSNSSATKVTDPSFAVLPPDRDLQLVNAVASTCAKNGVKAHWICIECKACFNDADGKQSVKYESLLLPLLSEHKYEFSGVLSESTIKVQGSELYVCRVCGGTEERPLPLLERWIKGDIDNDKKTNAVDTNLLKRIMAGTYNTCEQGLDAADYNDDGELNAMDSYLLRKIVVGGI